MLRLCGVFYIFQRLNIKYLPPLVFFVIVEKSQIVKAPVLMREKEILFMHVKRSLEQTRSREKIL